MPVIQQIISIGTGIGRKDFLPNVSVVLNQKIHVVQVSFFPLQQLFCYKVCCMFLYFLSHNCKNSRVCLDKQVTNTMLSIEQFSHTLSVIQVYRYVYIYHCVMENLSFAIQPVITSNVLCDLFRML